MIPDFTKTNGLLPVIIQDATSLQVLMLGYMDEEAFQKTSQKKKLPFLVEAKTDFGQKAKPLGIS